MYVNVCICRLYLHYVYIKNNTIVHMYVCIYIYIHVYMCTYTVVS